MPMNVFPFTRPHLLRGSYINFAIMTTLYFALVPQKF